MDDGHEAHHNESLDARSAAAVDRFFTHQVGSDSSDAQVRSLLGSLDSAPIETDRTLTDLVMLRVGRASEPHEPELCEHDRDALDAWVMSTGRPNAVPHDHRERAAWHDRTAGLITETQADLSPGDIVDRTLARIQTEIEAQSDRMRIPARRLPAIRLADVASIAAVLLLSVSLLIPAVNAFRADAVRAACASNLATAGMGFGLYAGDHDDSMPVAGPCDGGTWWDVGKGPGHSNAANLFTLIRQGYAGLEDLACAGNDRAVVAGLAPDASDWEQLEQVSYSYRVVFGLPSPPKLSSEPRQVVVADRSPVILAAIRRTPIKPTAASPNHGSGQRILFSDGSAEWSKTPVLANGDNIWLPASIERLLDAAASPRSGASVPMMGDESPSGPADAFVGP